MQYIWLLSPPYPILCNIGRTTKRLRGLNQIAGITIHHQEAISHVQQGILLPPQPASWISYLRSGRLLYLSLVLFVLESLFYWQFVERAYQRSEWLSFTWWFGCFLFAGSHIFLVFADGWSRYQDYKRVKDYLYLHGFDRRIVATHMRSMCQRTATITAAEELGMKEETTSYFYHRGYRWYHFVPDFMIRDPLFFFRKKFWSRTFLERKYTPRVDFHAIASEQKLWS